MSRPNKRKAEQPEGVHRMKDLPPDWMRHISTDKLERLWQQDEHYGLDGSNIPVRSLILVYGADRFFHANRDAILFGEDMEYDMQRLAKQLRAEQQRDQQRDQQRYKQRKERCEQRRKQRREQNQFIARVLLRCARERMQLCCFGEEAEYLQFSGQRTSVTQITWDNLRVLSVQGTKVKLRRENAPPHDKTRDVLARIGTVRNGHMYFRAETTFHRTTTHLTLLKTTLDRCKRLDAAEAAIVGALNEQRRDSRLASNATPFYTTPPIARFVSDRLYDMNVWRDILAFL